MDDPRRSTLAGLRGWGRAKLDRSSLGTALANLREPWLRPRKCRMGSPRRSRAQSNDCPPHETRNQLIQRGLSLLMRAWWFLGFW